MKWVGYVAYMDNAFCGTVLTLKCGVFTLQNRWVSWGGVCNQCGKYQHMKDNFAPSI
jgi:hypothetical protein